MFSNFSGKLKKTLVIGATTFALGCGSNIGEKPPEPEVQEFSGTQCLTAAKPVFSKFVTGDTTAAELSRSWDCVVVALDKFKKYVRGSERDRFTPQELATFLETNFMEANAQPIITPKLQSEMMKVKGLLIGGSHSFLTLDEIDTIVELISKLKRISVDILPSMKVVSMQWSPAKLPATKGELEYFESSNRALQKAAREISVLIESNGQNYVIGDFAVLMEELGRVFGGDWNFPDSIKKYLPVVHKLKKTIAGGAETTIMPSEWKRFILLGARGYVQFLRYEKFVKALPPSQKATRDAYFNLVLEDAFSAVEDILAEKPSEVITNEELFELIQAFSIVRPDLKLSRSFYNELLKLKTVVIGGPENKLTVSCVKNFKKKLPKILDLYEGFEPQKNILTLDWEPTKLNFEKAQKHLADSVKNFDGWLLQALQLLEGSYDLKNLPLLIAEYEKFSGKKQSDLNKQVKEFLPLIVSFKEMMFGDKGSLVKKSQWSSLSKVVSGGYGEFLYYHYFVKGRSLQKAQGISAFSTLGHSVIDYLRSLVQLKHNQFFAHHEILSIINFLAKKDVIPSSFSGAIADQALTVILNNVLTTPERRLAGKKPNALNMSALAALKFEFSTWIDAEILWVRATAGWDTPYKGYTNSQLYNYMREVAGSKSSSEGLKTAARELMLSTNGAYPISHDKNGFIRISVRGEPIYNFKALRDLNRNRMIGRILVRAFVNDLSRINTYKGATLAEVESAFNRLRGLAINLGLLAPDNFTFASSRFNEANIFTPHADGNNLASQAEITDLVGMIFSGINIHLKMKSALLKNCFARNTKVTDSSLINTECAKSAYKPTMWMVMTETPDYLRYMNQVSDANWSVYMDNIFIATGYIPNSRRLAKMGDIALTPHVIQYIEMIFAKYDTGRDGHINTDEAVRAYPSFDALIRDIAKDMIASGDVKESELFDIFGYILKNGRPPTTFTEKAKYALTWRGKREKWDLRVDRTQIARILGFIAEQTTPKLAP